MKPTAPNAVSPLEIRQALDRDLLRLLTATIKSERIMAAMAQDVAMAQKAHATGLTKTLEEIAELQHKIEETYTGNREILEDGNKSVQLQHGLLGFRTPSNPGLEPLSDKWTWPKILAAAKKFYGTKYLHKPKPPGLDKVKIKKELDAEKLAKIGVKLDDAETFYYELNLPAEADAVKVAA